MDWPQLIQIPSWTPLRLAGLQLDHIKDTLYRAGPNAYLIAVENSERTQRTGETRFITLLLWAETDGAALRAALMELESDEAASCTRPPGELQLPCGALTYGDIRAALRTGKHGLFYETANYRIASDGAFIHRVVHTPNLEFCFRGVTEQLGETPYAIQRRLR